MPEISICIPTYNCGEYLPAAIESVMRQGLDDFEIVISDNASEDNTELIVEGMRNARIRYFRNACNLGSRANIKRCLELAQGRYIKILCADDVLIEGLVEKQVQLLREQPGVALVTCNMLVTDSDLQVQQTKYMYPGAASGVRVTMACLGSWSNYIGGPTNFMFRSEDAAGLTFDESYRWLSDMKFGLQLLERGSYVNVDVSGYLYRRHAATDTALNCPPGIRIPEFLRLLDELNGWTLISCGQAVRYGGRAGMRAVAGKWWRACSITKVWQAIVALRDGLHMRRMGRVSA